MPDFSTNGSTMTPREWTSLTPEERREALRVGDQFLYHGRPVRIMSIRWPDATRRPMTVDGLIEGETVTFRYEGRRDA